MRKVLFAGCEMLIMDDLGLEKGKVRLDGYNAHWPELFKAEKELILQVAGGVIREIHHIGSTAIPGIEAKPIIDLMAVVEHFDQGKKLINALAEIGYVYHPDMEEENKLFYSKGDPTTHHLHILEQGCPRLAGYLKFRDAMIEDHALLGQYMHLKQDLAVKYKDDRAAYTAAKDAFIKSVQNRDS